MVIFIPFSILPFSFSILHYDWVKKLICPSETTDIDKKSFALIDFLLNLTFLGFINWESYPSLLHHGWRKFWILTCWNPPDWQKSPVQFLTMIEEIFEIWPSETTHVDSIFFSWIHFLLNLAAIESTNWEHLIVHFFTMVGEKFWLAEIPQIDRYLQFNSSPWLKKFLKFGHLKLPKLTASFLPEFIFF